MAEREGFEPSNPCGLRVLQTRALDHYATSPIYYLFNVGKLALNPEGDQCLKAILSLRALNQNTLFWSLDTPLAMPLVGAFNARLSVLEFFLVGKILGEWRI